MKTPQTPEERKEKKRLAAAAHYAAHREEALAKRKILHEKRREIEIARSRAWHAANRERMNARRKAYYWAHREESIAKQKISSRKRYYILKALREEQTGRARPDKCEICGGNSGGIVWDHCHKTEKFRGWLCATCNTALGLVKENPMILEKLIQYLKSHSYG